MVAAWLLRLLAPVSGSAIGQPRGRLAQELAEKVRDFELAAGEAELAVEPVRRGGGKSGRRVVLFRPSWSRIRRPARGRGRRLSHRTGAGYRRRRGWGWVRAGWRRRRSVSAGCDRGRRIRWLRRWLGGWITRLGKNDALAALLFVLVDKWPLYLSFIFLRRRGILLPMVWVIRWRRILVLILFLFHVRQRIARHRRCRWRWRWLLFHWK